MFLMIGVNPGRKELGNQGPITCGACGGYGQYQVYMTYMCLSLFFIPILKWGRQYYVETTCCHSLYELNAEVGKRIRRGEQVEIRSSDLTLVRQGGAQGNAYGAYSQSGYGNAAGTSGSTGTAPDLGRKCLACGYETMEDFDFCPRCGEKLRYKVK